MMSFLCHDFTLWIIILWEVLLYFWVVLKFRISFQMAIILRTRSRSLRLSSSLSSLRIRISSPYVFIRCPWRKIIFEIDLWFVSKSNTQLNIWMKNQLLETLFPPLSNCPSLISIRPKNDREHLYDCPAP